MNSLKITSKDLVSIVNDLKEKIKFNHILNEPQLTSEFTRAAPENSAPTKHLIRRFRASVRTTSSKRRERMFLLARRLMLDRSARNITTTTMMQKKIISA